MCSTCSACSTCSTCSTCSPYRCPSDLLCASLHVTVRAVSVHQVRGRLGTGSTSTPPTSVRMVLCCFMLFYTQKNRTCFDLFQLNFLQRSVCRAIRAMGKRSLVGKMVQCRIFRNWYSSNHFNSPMSWGASDRTQSRQSKFAERKGPQDVTSIGIVQECRECFCGSSRDTKTLPKCLQY